MTNEEKALEQYRAPRWEDFPKVDLYMDQVLSILNQWTAPLYFDSDKDAVTASMINNYVKHSLIKRPVRKHYRSYHLAYLYVVLVLKQCFSLEEVSELISIYYQIDSPEVTSRNFNRFSQILEQMLHEIMKTGKITVQFYENPNEYQLLMMRAIQSVVCRLYCVCQIHAVKSRPGENLALRSDEGTQTDAKKENADTQTSEETASA